VAQRQSNRWTTRRVLTRVVVLLALGFVVNVLVAWGIALTPSHNLTASNDFVRFTFRETVSTSNPHSLNTRSTTYLSMVSHAGSGEWFAVVDALHIQWRKDPAFTPEMCPGCTRPTAHSGVVALERSWRWGMVLPYVWLDHRCNGADPRFRASRSIRAVGWPLPALILALQGEIAGDDVLRADLLLVASEVAPGFAAIETRGTRSVRLAVPGDLALRGGVIIQPSGGGISRVRTASFPLRPIPIGAAINTLLYAALLALVWLALGAKRRFHRRRRGRCVHCGYDLKHDYASGCLECGWNKPATPGPEAPALAP
jgi:hypothetical protein